MEDADVGIGMDDDAAVAREDAETVSRFVCDRVAALEEALAQYEWDPSGRVRHRLRSAVEAEEERSEQEEQQQRGPEER